MAKLDAQQIIDYIAMRQRRHPLKFTLRVICPT